MMTIDEHRAAARKLRNDIADLEGHWVTNRPAAIHAEIASKQNAANYHENMVHILEKDEET